MRTKKKSILNQSIVSSISSQYIKTFIELFMGKKSSEIESVTFGEFVKFAKSTKPREHKVTLFQNAIFSIKRKLQDEKMPAEAHDVYMLV